MKKNKIFAFSIGLTLLLLLLTVKTVKPQNPSLPNQYKYGAIDKTGKYIIPPQFDNIQYFSEGLALVEVQGKTGYVDRTGKMVIPLFEGYAKSFSEGLAAAIKRGYKYGYIDKTGKYVIPPHFDEVASFHEGIAAVGTERRYGYINQQGSYVIPPRLSITTTFKDGLAIVGGTKYSIIDKTGKAVSQAFNYIDDPSEFRVTYTLEFKDGLMKVGMGGSHCRFGGIRDGKWGYIDRAGKLVIPLKLDNANDFYEGRAEMFYATSSYEDATGPYEAESCSREGKWGYIDKQGNNVIPGKFDEVRDFSEGMAAVRIGKRWGYINLEGEMVVPPRFQESSNGQPSKFSEGLVSVVMPQTQKSGYIDKNGQFVIDPIFDEASDFKDGLAIVRINEKKGAIDKKGNYVVEPKFESLDIFSEGLAAAAIDKKLGYIDKTGQLIIKPQFDIVDRFKQGIAIVGMKKEMPDKKDCEGNECNNQSQQKIAEPSHHFCSLNLHGFLGRLTD